MNERFSRAAADARIELAHEADFTLGRLEVRPSLWEIACDGRREIIDRRVMQVLVALARTQGGVVSRDDLIESCWDGVVVGEDAINNCIRRLRKVAEASGNAFSIETVPRVGYRLKVAEGLSPGPGTHAENTTRPQPPAPLAGPPPADTPPVSGIIHLVVISVLALLVLCAAGIATWHFWPKAPEGPVEASVAVLPFVNMSGDPKQEYFSDGFSEELINDLANAPHLNVASRTSSFTFKGRNEDIKAIARELGVGAVVEGSVREAGDRVRITAQLIDARDGYHLWSAAYDDNLSDILSLQDELARAIASALTHRLAPVSTASHPKIDPAAYRLYLQALREINQIPPDSFRKAFATFTAVTTKAPRFGEAYYWLSAAALNLAEHDQAHSASFHAIASDAARTALSLDPHDLHARWVRGEVETEVWDWNAAAFDLRMLRTQRPKVFTYFSGLSYYFQSFGFMDEALAAYQRFLANGPRYAANRYVTLGLLSDAGRFQQEIDLARTMLADRPHDVEALTSLCSAYAASSQMAEAKATARELRALQVNLNSQTDYQDCAWSIDMATGNQADALRLLQVWESEFPDRGAGAGHIASDYVLLGDFTKASDWFTRAYERRESDFFEHLYHTDAKETFLSKVLSDQAFAKYRATPQYKALAQKPLFKEWQVEHDRIAAALAAHRDPLN